MMSILGETPEQLLRSGAHELGIDLDDAAVTCFMRYAFELVEWNARFNLTTITDIHDIIIKHFLDSLVVLKVFTIPYGVRVIDIGAGAGFPGVPLKLVRPDLDLTLLESSIKKAGFLEHLTDALNLVHVSVVAARAEDFGRINHNRDRFDVALSRAVADVVILAEYALPLLKQGGRLISYKAKRVDEELQGAEFAVRQLGGRVEEIAKVVVPFLQAERYLVSFVKETATPHAYPRKAGIPTKRPLMP